MNNISGIIKKAYNKMIEASSKFDVEYPTDYGKRKMRTTYNSFDKLCKQAGLNTIDVASDLFAEQHNAEQDKNNNPMKLKFKIN